MPAGRRVTRLFPASTEPGKGTTDRTRRATSTVQRDFRARSTCASISWRGDLCRRGIFGDFMGNDDVGQFEARLAGLAYDRPAISETLADVNVTTCFGDASRDNVIGCSSHD